MEAPRTCGGALRKAKPLTGALGLAMSVLVASACSGSAGPAEGAASPPPATRATASASASAPSSAPGTPWTLGRYQPLWPFRSADEVRTWQAAYRSGGHQPWRLSPEETALAFVRHLGFKAIDRVTGRVVGGDDAHIAVGRRGSEGPRPAAVLHLVRLGHGADAPWEVVGTDDKDLTLTIPSYGSAVSSPVTVGGSVTGVDESLRVAVHQVSSASAIGEFCCVSAGGFPGSPGKWSAKVPFRAGSDPVLVIVVSTGGHVADVERFAVTGVRKA
jgi:hypothetical protein